MLFANDSCLSHPRRISQLIERHIPPFFFLLRRVVVVKFVAGLHIWQKIVLTKATENLQLLIKLLAHVSFSSLDA